MSNLGDKTKIILDVDTGEDDAMAILLAIKEKLPLTHIISSYGNTTINNSTRNSADILSLAKAYNIDVIKGSSHSIKKHKLEESGANAYEFTGKNGICNVKLKKSRKVKIFKPKDNQFEDFVFKILSKNVKTTYIVTGPLTNLAKLCKKHPKKVQELIDQVYIMGGAIFENGNSGPINKKTKAPVAEFNFYCDPDAVKTVLQSKLMINLITWDITSKITLPFDRVFALKSRSPIGTFVINLIRNFCRTYGLKNKRNFEFNDPLTIMAYLGDEKYRKISVKIKSNKKNYGTLVKTKQGKSINYFNPSKKFSSTAVKYILNKLDVTMG